MDSDFCTGVERRRFGSETYDLPPTAQGPRLQFQIPAASGSSNATSSSSSSSFVLTTMASSTMFANLFAVSNLVVLCTRFVVRVEQQLLRRVLGHPLSALTHPYRRFLSILLFAVTVIVCPSSAQLADSSENEISALMGHDILIPCDLVTTGNIKCPEIHSIKWYQNDQRIYMYSDILAISNPEGRFQLNQPQQPSRAMYKANSTPPALYISPVQIADEGIYRCDVTYKDLTPGCPAGSTVKLTTFARPQEPEIFLDPTEGEDYSVTSTLVGPYYEGYVATFICEAAGGKPPANVVWYKGSESLGGDFIEEEDKDGTTTVKNRIRIKITEADLLARYECHVNHKTLDPELTAWIEINVHVAPKKLELIGNTTYFEDDEVTLTCMAKGARPAADIKWYNSTDVITMHSPSSNKTLDADGTSTSYSTLTFPASRFDDEEMFSCEATNQATEDGHAKSLKNSTTLVVYYAPIVQLLPDVDVLEINESSPFHLECSFEANPVDEKTRVTWIRDSLRIVGTDDDGADDDDGEDLSEGSNMNSNGLNDPQNGDEGAVEEGRFYYDIESIQRHHEGVYSCEVENLAGIGRSENVNVSVLYPPEVRMIIFPTLAIEHKTNVTLTCEIEDANPAQVTSVRWYRNGAIFNETDETTLFLPVVDRTFHGNYSCQAENRVGWSNISEAILLNLWYTPGPAKLTHKPDEVVKGGEVALFCEVDDPGNPPATDYVWKRGTFFFLEVHNNNLTLENLHLNARDNYSCTPRNEAGSGIAGELSLDVYAPPAFRTELLPYHGALETATDISLTCQVECHPRCRIEWLRDGEVLRIPSIEGNGDELVEDEDEANAGNGNSSNGHENETTNKNDDGDGVEGDNDGEDGGDWDDRYSVKISYLDFDMSANHFPSVISTLRWNMSTWPNGRLDRVEDTAKYTCRSSPNKVGPGVSYTTVFNVEYPPENISLSSYKVNVKEGENISSPVTCLASGHPEVQYVWTYNGEPVSSTNELRLGFPVSRDHSGLYYCTATNPHGNASTNVFLDVLYEPECQLDATMEDIGTVLTCTVAANPKIVEFEWLLDNETIQENIRSDGLTSRLIQVQTGGRYICVVNNSIGQSEACILELQGADGAMYVAGFVGNHVIFIVIIVVAIIIIAIIIAVVIILVLKRRGAVGKSGKPRRSDQPTGPVSEGDRAFYENLPFHGLQPAPNKPFKPALPDLEYADVEFPPQDQQVDGTPQRPPRTGKPTTNNSHS